MIVSDASAFLAQIASGNYPVRTAGTARGAFLVSPASDGLAAQSAIDNRYMDLSRVPDASRARRQHADLARRLGADVPVVTFAGDPECPDGVFPNNVFATTRGQLIIGRMRHAVRRREAARSDIRGFFRDVLHYRETDLSGEAFVAELTGSVCIDRARGIGYCGLSERCDMAGARAMFDAFGLRLMFVFDLAPGEYHTNVVLAILAGRAAILAPDGFADAAVPAAIAQAYSKRTVALSVAQKRAFAGNAIALAPGRTWMSAAGAAALEPAQLALLERAGLTVDDIALDEIEKSGGSLRCCVAELF
ncbi:MAG: arginine deiminase-related protein [Dokdonella sp.]|uniref:arginine deiminase-related protein n=1 Tax=Dokdonella sp. TaxID=2291710 RepID=UPI003267EE5A